MIDLDPKILDQEAIRKKRRRKLLLIALAPLTIIILAALFFMRPAVFDGLYGMNYGNPTADNIIAISQMHKNMNAIEPYIAFYDAGTAYLKNGDAEKAEAELRNSIANMPPKDTVCKVRTNLAYSIELQADEAVNNKRYGAALTLYSKANGVLAEDNCAQTDEKSAQAEKRIDKKRNSAVARMNNAGDQGDGNNDGGDGNNGPVLGDDVIQQIQQNIIDPTQVRDQIYGSPYSGSGSGGSGSAPTIKNW